MNEHNERSMLWPTYALRAWLATLVGSMERAKDDIEKRVEAYEKEIARLRGQRERCEIALTSLHEAVGAVDGVLRSRRDVDLHRAREGASDTKSGERKPDKR